MNITSEQLRQRLMTSKSLAGQTFSDNELALFVRYYEQVLKWNARLLLTTITEPVDFAERHLLEAAILRQHVSVSAKEVWDLGTGLGIPGVVIAVLCPFLKVKLVEANRKKCYFLEEIAFQLSLANVSVVNQRIEALPAPDATVCLTGRAIDGMESLLPRILKLGNQAAQTLILGTIATEALLRLHLGDDRTLVRNALPARDASCLLAISGAKPSA